MLDHCWKTHANPTVHLDGLILLTLTTLSSQALRFARTRGALCVGITNVAGSAIARETSCGVHVNAGCEIGVASTKAYTSQIVVLIMVAVSLGQDHLSKVARCRAMTAALEKLPDAVSQVMCITTLPCTHATVFMCACLFFEQCFAMQYAVTCCSVHNTPMVKGTMYLLHGLAQCMACVTLHSLTGCGSRVNMPLCLQVLKLNSQIQTIAETLKDEASLLVFGRGRNYATALETALKVSVGWLKHVKLFFFFLCI